MHKKFKASTLAAVGMVVLSASSANAASLGEAIANKNSSYTLSGDQQVSASAGQMNHTMTINGNNHSINGPVHFWDKKEGNKYTTTSGLTASNVGHAIVNDDYSVSVTDAWTSNTGKSSILAQGDLNLNNNVFANNTAGAGAGSSVKKGGAIQVLGAVDDYMQATGHRQTTININNNKFYNNAAYHGGAIDFDNPNAITKQLNGNVFIANKATEHGGAFDTHTFIEQMNNNKFVKNASPLGGAIYAHTNTRTTGTGNLFKENTASKDGGAVYLQKANAGFVQLNSSTFEGNTATEHGGAIFNNGIYLSSDSTYRQNQASHGGAVFNMASSDLSGSGVATITDSSFANNNATYGGAIYNTAAGVVQLEGHNRFTGNAATQNGGAIYIAKSKNGYVRVSSADFINNSASSRGGAVYNGGVFTVDKANFNQNSAVVGGAVYNAASTDTVGSGVATMDNVSFAGNTSTRGGAIYNSNEAVLNLKDSSFVNNYASQNGSDIYNEGSVNFSGDNSFSEESSKNSVYNTGTFNVINGTTTFGQGVNALSKNKTGTINVGNAFVDIGISDVYADKVNFNNGSTLITHVKDAVEMDDKGSGTYGRIIANAVGINRNKSEMQIVIRDGEIGAGETHRLHIIDTDDFNGEFVTLYNNKYDIKAEGNGWYIISSREEKPEEDPCDGPNPPESCGGTVNPDPVEIYEPKICKSIDCVDDVWIDGKTEWIPEGSLAEDVLDEFNRLTQYGSGDDVLDANYGIAPDLSPIIQAHAMEINRNLNKIIRNRLYGSMERTGYTYRGKRYFRFPRHESHLWAEGILGKSKWNVERGFDGDTKGLAVGFDGKVSDAVRLGVAYAYTIGEFDSIQRETEIDSHTGMFYGEYNPNRFYANWAATYTRSAYDEVKKVGRLRVGADFDVDAVGAQVMVGTKVGPVVNGNWSTGVFMPEIGLRYLYTKQGDYTDEALQKVKGQDGQTVTGIAGMQYTIGYKLSDNVSWYPELRAALTYDFVQADNKTRVNLVNGNIYELEGDQMDRFGIELGARAGLDIQRKVEMSLEYDGVFQGDYTNHTGMANMKYKF